ncbi:MAG: YraN family protein [Patescibacteria group bacterium]
MTDSKNLGIWGENFAKVYLEQKSYIFCDSNYRGPGGEIDLIFRFNKQYIFVEVKTRIKTSESRYENPLLKWQTKNLQRTIIDYCRRHHISLDSIRLDLIFILVDRTKRLADIKHYPDIL